jgi:hypothetical protein
MVYTGHIAMILSVPIRPDRIGWDGEKESGVEQIKAQGRQNSNAQEIP